jgi:hypothetical protein
MQTTIVAPFARLWLARLAQQLDGFELSLPVVLLALPSCAAATLFVAVLLHCLCHSRPIRPDARFGPLAVPRCDRPIRLQKRPLEWPVVLQPPPPKVVKKPCRRRREFPRAA